MGAVVGGDDEGDRAEAFLAVGGAVGGIHFQQQRRTYAGAGELRVFAALAVEDDFAQFAAGEDALGRRLGLDGAEHTAGAVVVGEETAHGLGQRIGDLVEADVLLAIADAAARYIDGLGGGAHLPGIQAETERQIARHRLEVAHAVDDHGVDAGLLGEYLGLTGVVFQPVAEGAGTGEVDQFDPRIEGQRLADRSVRGIHDQADQRGVEAQLSKDFLSHTNT
ncbi:hypothetical protein D3C81_1272620 [compost metagenome]